MASARVAACAGLATLLRITPATERSGSKVRKPCTTAAALRAMEEQSTTRITGRPSSFATRAVEQRSSAPESPSNRPMTPSTMPSGACSRSSPSMPRRKTWTISSSGINQVSKLREGRPQTLVWYVGSM